ncbi:MAG TPA: beta-propeller domain-containing protein, partial [Gaiellaceae bacterium]|nr:beta-propeller domain-containing protein [Gaiellaceae bacterium]
MHFSTRVVLPAAFVLLVAAALVGTADRSAAEPAKAPRLTTFGSCGQLLAYAKANAGRFVGPYGLGGQIGIAETTRASAPAPSAPKQGVDYSGTNVQEEGVDEPDIVKTDGNTLYAIANGKLNAVDVSDPKPHL